jgi:hypothetical protein
MRTPFTGSTLKFICCFLLVFGATVVDGAPPKAKEGVLDIHTLDLSRNRVALSGAWRFFDNELVSPAHVFAEPPMRYVEFPQTWNNVRTSDSGLGYATYGLKVIASKDEKSLALEFPQIYSSYVLWVNDKVVAQNGRVGTTMSEVVPQWMPQTVSFSNPGDTLRIVLQIANFQHHTGGSKDPIYLASSELLQLQRSTSVTANLVESITLALIGVGFLLTFIFTEKKAVILYFALLCLTWALRVGFSNLYIFISFMPDFDWNTMIRIEYITLFLTMTWAILFLSRVFPKEESRIVKALLIGVNVLFIIYACISTPLAFTKWLPVYLGTSGALLVFGAYVVLRAWVNQRMGSTHLAFSIILALVVFSYDVFSYKGYFDYNALLFSICYIIIFSLMSIVLLLHLNIIKSKEKSVSILTYKDLYKNNDIPVK